jgi:hypothetical protein
MDSRLRERQTEAQLDGAQWGMVLEALRRYEASAKIVAKHCRR